jgi:ATP-binding protein involved in chromosome partitioning
MKKKVFARKVQGNLSPNSHIKNIIAVASGKGGVGKSTVAVNLALALQKKGYNVGLLDADIYGPSQPHMLGLRDQKPESDDGKKIGPIRKYGLQTMSIGYLVDAGSAMIWRGPMVSGALQQLMNDTAWNDLDYLVMDLPPGTGDIQLTMAQKIPVTGMLIVTTPQDVALLDVRKALAMANKVAINVLGVVENMSTYTCSACGHHESIFGEAGGAKIAQEFQLDCLQQLPLDKTICLQGDRGEPIVAADPEGKIASLYHDLATKTVEKIDQLDRDYSTQFGSIVVE